MKSMIAVLVLSIASVSWAGQQVKPGGPAFAYDANGKKVGRVIDVVAPPAYANVTLRIGGITTTAQVSRNALGVGAEQLMFQSVDCTGTAYLEEQPTAIFETLSSPVEPGATVYAKQPGATVQTVTIAAQKADTECDAYTGKNPVQAFPAVPLVDLSGQFTPPFSVR